MKIVILDGHTENPGDLSWDGFAALGELSVHDRTCYDAADPAGRARIFARAKGAAAVILNKTPLDAGLLDELAPELRYIGVLATGYNVVDVKRAAENGVTVCNIPTYGTAAVAQMTAALLLELCHHAGAHSDSVHRGDWAGNVDWCYWNYPLMELDGKTAGFIGFGRIGQAAARILRAMGMEILAYDAHPQPELENEHLRYASLEELFRRSDVVSLHCPLFPETKGIIGRENIARMKDGALLLNTSRGPLVDEAALAEALNSGKLAGAALDVVSSEPIKQDNPLLSAKNCILTPHIAWAPKESRQRLLDIASANLAAYLKGTPKNIVKG